MRLLAGLAVGGVVLAGCGTSGSDIAGPAPSDSSGGFRSTDCNAVTDADVTKAVGSTFFTRVVVSDVGCFWQENTAIGDVGLGMGISTWWYRGSGLDAERSLERNAGRTLTELTIDGNTGFKAYDGNACSVYVAKGSDVITWSIQTVNAVMLPDLCSITETLAQLSQDRVS
ncbi:DUF3558 domain-containing protein [Mycolicibacterium sp.]|uniref:DUF3558 domain-containing protein n=1 Tax=Mycolicibacterium sp. TaxID=2320850 RepID=UPI001A306E1B|nr:DUF3558 domain-containing protein [Mycolicibacterium sp.]MBJ7336845.1 DUF3558 domain-containing protein [Mycolicibacterium sp.]